jgi:hypothetical protein
MGIEDLCSNRRALRKYLRCSMAVEQKKVAREHRARCRRTRKKKTRITPNDLQRRPAALVEPPSGAAQALDDGAFEAIGTAGRDQRSSIANSPKRAGT